MDLITHDFQVPVRSPDDILELLVWLPLRSHRHKVVHWFSSGFVSRNDLHVPEPNGRFGRESALPSPENSTGLHRHQTTMLLLCIYVYILSSQIFFPVSAHFPLSGTDICSVDVVAKAVHLEETT